MLVCEADEHCSCLSRFLDSKLDKGMTLYYFCLRGTTLSFAATTTGLPFDDCEEATRIGRRHALVSLFALDNKGRYSNSK